MLLEFQQSSMIALQEADTSYCQIWALEHPFFRHSKNLNVENLSFGGSWSTRPRYGWSLLLFAFTRLTSYILLLPLLSRPRPPHSPRPINKEFMLVSCWKIKLSTHPFNKTQMHPPDHISGEKPFPLGRGKKKSMYLPRTFEKREITGRGRMEHTS